MSATSFFPMYDVPGTRDHAATLWASLRDAIRDAGLDAPEHTIRIEERLKGWLHPGLVLGQTCGLPYITKLCHAVELIGTPDYGVDGCPPGFYHSTLIVAAADPRHHLSEFFGSTLALNGTDSQSGYGAIMKAAAPLARDGCFFGRALLTGSHKASMMAVASGKADIAAIDSVTWRLSQRFDPSTSGLKSIGTTEPTPSLPFISAAGNSRTALFGAATRGLSKLPESTRDAFGLKGFLRFRKRDYEVLETNLKQAEALHALPEPEYPIHDGS